MSEGSRCQTLSRNRSVALGDPATQMNQKPLWQEPPPLTLERGIAQGGESQHGATSPEAH